MANYSISVRLASCCCDCNYLQHVCRMKAQAFGGRKYEFMWSEFALTAMLHCNGVCIGVVSKGSLSIYPQFKTIIPTESCLRSIIALFNLYPF